jgi:hypothetical protein
MRRDLGRRRVLWIGSGMGRTCGIDRDIIIEGLKGIRMC